MILGLEAGFVAAMLIGLYVHNEHRFESFISGYEQIYRLEADRLVPGREPERTGFSLGTEAAQITLDFPEVAEVVRLALSSQVVGKEQAENWERVALVDPEFFNVHSIPRLAGEPCAAIA